MLQYPWFNTGMSQVNRHSLLEAEVYFLHLSLFGRSAPKLLVDAYLRAHQDRVEFGDIPLKELISVRVIVENSLDACAIEPWLRRKKNRHALSQKLLLISYIANCAGQHPEYRNSSAESVYRGWFKILVVGFISCLRLIRGRYLKVRYGLV